jgi:hypothetical protein
MAYQRLGEQDRARSFLDKSASWMEKQPRVSDEARRFRQEAEALLNGSNQKSE